MCLWMVRLASEHSSSQQQDRSGRSGDGPVGHAFGVQKLELRLTASTVVDGTKCRVPEHPGFLGKELDWRYGANVRLFVACSLEIKG